MNEWVNDTLAHGSLGHRYKHFIKLILACYLFADIIYQVRENMRYNRTHHKSLY